MQKKINEAAEKLYQAFKTGTPIPSFKTTYPDFTHDEAYKIQLINAEKDIASGRKLVGYKVGLTSFEAQKMFNVFEPDFGHLFSDMEIKNQSEISLSKMIQPKIEAELTFKMKKELKGPNVTFEMALDAVDTVMASLEIVDSRIENWKITGVDTISDNGSSAFFVLGDKKIKADPNVLPFIGMSLSKNEEVLLTGSGAAVMGNPIYSIVFLANTLAKHGISILPDQIILTGALSSMLKIEAGDFFCAEMLNLGKVGVRFTKDTK